MKPMLVLVVAESRALITHSAAQTPSILLIIAPAAALIRRPALPTHTRRPTLLPTFITPPAPLVLITPPSLLQGAFESQGEKEKSRHQTEWRQGRGWNVRAAAGNCCGYNVPRWCRRCVRLAASGGCTTTTAVTKPTTTLMMAKAVAAAAAAVTTTTPAGTAVEYHRALSEERNLVVVVVVLLLLLLLLSGAPDSLDAIIDCNAAALPAFGFGTKADL